MNNIFNRQNEKGNIELLVAQRFLYTRSKRYFLIRMFGSLFFAIFGPILITSKDNLGFYLSFVAVFYLIAEIFILKRLETAKKEDATKIQEFYDTKVLDIEWNDVAAGEKPTPENIQNALKKFPNGAYPNSLFNWYFNKDYNIPATFGQLLCQRSNVSWDSNLRRNYAYTLTAILILIVITCACLAIHFSTSTGMSFYFLASILPLFIFLLEQIIDNIECSQRLERLREKTDSLLEKFNSDRTSTMTTEIRSLQNEIFHHRKSSPLILDWIYNKLRNNHQKQMVFSVEKKVEEFNATNGSGLS